MKDLKILSEMTTRYGTRNVNELEFKTPEEFATYKKKHKMRPGTVVKVAGKDKKVGDDKPKGRRMQITMDFQSSNREDLEKFADKYGLKLGIVDNNPNYGLEAEFEGSEENLKKFMTSDDYGLDEKDFDDYAREYGDVLDDESEVDSKIDKDMSSAANKANMKMDRDEIMGLLNAKNEPFAEEVYDILDDNFDKMGSLGKELKMDVDTLAAYEMGIYDMSEKEYEQGREELKKKLGDYYKEQGLDESLKKLSKITTRYNK